MDDPTPPQADDQYSRAKTVGIWFLGGAPMWILGWLVYPAISKGMAVADAGLMRLLLMTIGLAWQFVLAMIILYCEEGNIRWATICRRFWLRHPISPKTGRVDKRLWWWLIPLGVLVVAVDFVIAGPINDLWVTAMPFLAEPEGYHASALGWLLLLIVAMFAQFVLTSRLAGPIYDPVGKYYGVFLFTAASLTVLLRSAGARRVPLVLIVGFTVASVISRTLFLLGSLMQREPGRDSPDPLREQGGTLGRHGRGETRRGAQVRDSDRGVGLLMPGHRHGLDSDQKA